VRSAGFALTAIRFAKALQIAYPSKRVLIYSNKPVYNKWSWYFTEEFDEWPYMHAQYPWATWNKITVYFMKWWSKLFLDGAQNPDLPKSRKGDYEIWQVMGKSGLGFALGAKSRDIDVGITRRLRADFIEWIGRPERWSKPSAETVVPDPEVIVEDDGVPVEVVSAMRNGTKISIELKLGGL